MKNPEQSLRGIESHKMFCKCHLDEGPFISVGGDIDYFCWVSGIDIIERDRW